MFKRKKQLGGENARRHKLYLKLARGKSLSVGLHQKGWLIRRWYWVSHKERAVLLSDMANDHLWNTIRALRDRHPDEPIQPLLDEYCRRDRDRK